MQSTSHEKMPIRKKAPRGYWTRLHKAYKLVRKNARKDRELRLQYVQERIKQW